MATPVHPYSDYGVALRTLKSARGWLSIFMVLCVLTQFVGFSIMYWTQQPYLLLKAQYTHDTRTHADELRQKLLPTFQSLGVVSQADSQTALAFFERSPESRKLNIHPQWDFTYTMAVPVTQVLGLVSAASQVIIVFLTMLVVLVAQAPGIAQITRSLISTILLSVIVFPWQFVFTQGFPIPGVFYGYHEMLTMIGPVKVGEAGSRFQQLIVLARFIVWPLLSLLVLLITSERFRSGIQLAIGHPLQSIMQGRPAGALPPTAVKAPARPMPPTMPQRT